MTQTASYLSEQLRIAADGVRKPGERWTDQDIMRIAANRIEELEDDVRRLHKDKINLLEKYEWQKEAADAQT